MFKLATKNTVLWPVTVNVPADGGGVAKHTMSVEFLVLPQDEMERAAREGDDLLARTVCGWKDGAVMDESGQAIAFSDEAKARLLNIPYVRTALFAALAEINQGRAAARKN